MKEELVVTFELVRANGHLYRQTLFFSPEFETRREFVERVEKAALEAVAEVKG